MPDKFANLQVMPGRAYPMGTAVYDEGVRFAVFSRHATRVWLALFERVEDLEPAWEYEFDPHRNRIGDVWTVFVRGLHVGAYYKFRMDGPFDEKTGHRFNPRDYLLDPYARAMAGDIHDRTIKCVVVHDYLDWTDDEHPRTPMKNSIIYETHVRGLTQDPSSGVAHPGTYKGLIEKIPYLKELGVTAVELLPIQEFGENLLGRCSLTTGKELTNYWGYSNIGFFAPTGRYACESRHLEHLEEFREMVHALHKEGIEIILDVVFNHTSEGNERGPTLCFRGIDNTIYYLLDDGAYLNFSGCGNTVNCDHPLVHDFILDCLRYWVAVMHVDGFRFDLASILGRDQKGGVNPEAPLVRRISEDPVLRDVKLIAEAWDAGGAYHVGSFGGVRWAEWNGKYRDDVRRYWRGDPGTRGVFASRLTGSADLYQWNRRTPEHSINFITCHDGFTLRDLVSYNKKHNEANGEGNQDGENENVSWNCGIEGETDNPEINALRLRMQKNYIATLFLSLGVPMILGGDEFGRTQQGNNNAYCQDNKISWFDWTLTDKNQELHRFVKEMIAFRKRNTALSQAHYYRGKGHGMPAEDADLLWFAPCGGDVDWFSHETPLACRVHSRENGDLSLYLMFNNLFEEVTFQLPDGPWRQCINTALSAPDDIAPQGADGPAANGAMILAPKSVVVLSMR